MKKEYKITIIIIATIYLIGASFFNNRFLPRTFVNETNVSGQKLSKIEKELANQVNWKGLKIKSDDEILLEITPEEINYEYVENAELSQLLRDSNSWTWPLSLLSKTELKAEPIYIHNSGKLNAIINDFELLEQESQDATIKYSEELGKFEIVEHQYGVNLNKEQLKKLIVDKIKAAEELLDISEFLEKPEIMNNNDKLTKSVELANEYLDLELKYKFEDKYEIVNKDLIKDWIYVSNGEIEFNKDSMREWVIENLSKKYDTYGKPKPFKTTAGKTITLSKGSYGWLIHRANTVDALVEHIKNNESKIIEPVYSYKALTRKNHDIGNSYVEIDITNQTVYVYSKGELKVTTPTVTGNISKGHDTPKGRVDPITYKARNVVLRGPGYASPVKYWMPFNGGVGLHDADWRSEFGGQIYKTNGSHGCINLPPPIAKDVYDLVFQGMPVIVY